MKRVLITGHTSGLGKAIWQALRSTEMMKIGWSLESGVDISDPDSISQAAENVFSIDILINCAGVNFIDWHESISLEDWDRLMNVNARAIWLITKQLLQGNKFKKPATILNIVSNASHVPMTNSAAYNASKGAAHILTLQMARELKKRHNITVFGLSPNKMSGTKMSNYIEERVCELRGWTKEQAGEYQKAALPAGEETDPRVVAEFISYLLSSRERHKYLNGCVIPYGA